MLDRLAARGQAISRLERNWELTEPDRETRPPRRTPSTSTGGRPSPEGDRARAPRSEGIQERSHGPLPEARIAGERRRSIEERGHPREEAQCRARVPCVDRGTRGAQGIRSDPEAIRGSFNLSTERGHPF